MFKTFLAELKHIFRTNKWRPWEWLFIAIIPFLYGFLYMNAYWDPFGKTENLKIAVVNLDQSDESKLFVDKIVEKGGKGFDIGSRNYKFNIYDASSIYEPYEMTPEEKLDMSNPASPTHDATSAAIGKKQTAAADEGLEKAKQLVDEGKYQAVIIIDQLFTSNRKSIKEALIKSLEDNIKRISDDQSADRTLNLSEVANNLHNSILNSIYSTPDSPQGNQLITFYNSYKNSYLAGEMTNFGAGLSTLEMDAIIPTEEEFLSDVLQISYKEAATVAKYIESLNIFPVNLVPTNVHGVNLGTSLVLKLLDEFNKELEKNPKTLLDIASGIKDSTFKDALTKVFLNMETHAVKEAVATLANNPGLVTSMLNFVKLATSQGLEMIDDSKSVGTNINTYGFGLAPYFMCIALWAGSIVMLFLIKNDRHIKGQSTLKHYFGKSLVWVGTAWIQALILATAFTIQGVNLGLAHQWEVYALALFVATIFSLTVQGVGYAFRYGDMADFAAVILLVIQLVSSSGTFPVAMQWGIFRVIHPVVPFTYAINAMREIFFKPDIGNLFQNLGILMTFPIVFGSFAIAVNWHYDKRTVIRHKDGTFEYKSFEIHLDDH